MSPRARTVFVVAAVLALGYALFRSGSAKAATLDGAAGMTVSGGGGGGGSGGGGVGGTGGGSIVSTIGEGLQNILDTALGGFAAASDPPSITRGPEVAPTVVPVTVPVGSVNAGPLPVSVTQIQDAPRVAAAIETDPGADWYGFSDANSNKRYKAMFAD